MSTEIRLDASGNPTSEWTKYFVDGFGRRYLTLYSSASGSPERVSYYNSLGQLTNDVDADGVSSLFAYDANGKLLYTAADMNQNGNIDFGGSDRITMTTNDIVSDHGVPVRRLMTAVWATPSSNSSNVVSVAEFSADSLQSWQVRYRDASTTATNHSQTVYGSNGARTVTNTAPEGSYTVAAYSYGRPASVTSYDTNGTQVGGATYGYDPHGRQTTNTDAHNGATVQVRNNADQVTTNTTPSPDGVSAGQSTVTQYDLMSRPVIVTQPDGTVVSNIYLPTGDLAETFGSRTYPVAYGYDYAGRMKTMTNWSNFGAGTGARVTTWNFDVYRGWLSNKTYDGGTPGPNYAYSAAGRLATRKWVRGVSTTNSYDNGGSLNTVTYSDSTPAVTNTYDRQGRLSTVVRNGMTDSLYYNQANQLVGESFSGGPLAGLAVTNLYDQFLRRTNLSALTVLTTLSSAAFGYDAASRLASVFDGTNGAAYSYVANSPMVSQIAFTNNGVWRMTTTKQYDFLNRLTSISSAPSAPYTLPESFNYNYNTANQRTQDTLADGEYWKYGYDALGQVTNGVKYFSDATPVAGQQFDYAFDTIGNRTQAQAGGDQTGANLRVANYTNNTLNQLTSRDVPGYADIMGASTMTNPPTVNGQTAYRRQEYFRQQLAVNNSTASVWTNIVVSGGQSVTGNVYLAKEPEVFSYDADGNLTNDGRWSYTWDGENRLIGMTANTSIGPQYHLTFGYDSQGRRIQKIVTTNSLAYSTNLYLYDGWNLVSRLDGNDSLQQAYVWGLDLSGTAQGAGGVGGLLEVSYHGNSITNCFPSYDGNGNVMALINAADGTSVGQYDYGPFGEVIRTTGPMAKANSVRFSSKYEDDETDLLYYTERFLDSGSGRWFNRDPIEDITWMSSVQWLSRVGMSPTVSPTSNLLNPYHFLFNDGIDKADYLGLAPKAGDPCCSSKRPCEIRARLTRVSVAPTLSGGGCNQQIATSWSITVAISYVTQGDCVILGCEYWTCDQQQAVGTPGSNTSGQCGGWTYNVGGPVGGGVHVKAMTGFVDYLSCEGGVYVKEQVRAGDLVQVFFYSPPSAWSGGEQLWP